MSLTNAYCFFNKYEIGLFNSFCFRNRTEPKHFPFIHCELLIINY
jgi:hypothetical protein